MSQSQFAKPHQTRPQWKSRLGFILAAIGSAVGLGNIWRFSYLAYKNGGGAFLVPYLIALLVVGIPLMILELGIGHRMRGSAPMTFAKIDSHWEWCGWWGVISAMFGIMLYYSVVVAWCISYVFFSFNLSWGTDSNDFFFNQYLQVSSGPFDIGDIRAPIMFALLLIWVASWVIVNFGVQKGVERANKIFMPLLIVLIFSLVIWSMTLEGSAQGLAVYLTPDWTKLGELSLWIDAFSQIFFTLSLGFGIMITYASYLPKKVNIVKDATIICFANCFFSFIAGFAVFGTLGYMANATGKSVADVVSGSIGLAFVVYPKAISLLPAFAELFGVVFFSLLVVAGLSSAISLIEAFSSAVIDKFQYSRKLVVSWVCIIGFLASIIFSSKCGLYWVDIVDHFLTHYGLVIIGIIECLLVGWIYKAYKLRQHIEGAGSKRLPAAWDICIRVITPLVLFMLLINDFVDEINPPPYEGYSWMALVLIGRDWLVLTLIASLFISVRPWQKIEKSKESD